MWHFAARIACVVLGTFIVVAAQPDSSPDDTGQAGSAPPAPEVLRLPDGWQLNRGPLGTMRT
jgi:hypothetical protein